MTQLLSLSVVRLRLSVGRLFPRHGSHACHRSSSQEDRRVRLYDRRKDPAALRAHRCSPGARFLLRWHTTGEWVQGQVRAVLGRAERGSTLGPGRSAHQGGHLAAVLPVRQNLVQRGQGWLCRALVGWCRARSAMRAPGCAVCWERRAPGSIFSKWWIPAPPGRSGPHPPPHLSSAAGTYFI